MNDSGLGSQLRTKLPDINHQWNRNHYPQEGNHDVCPAVAERLIHARRKEGEKKGAQTLQELVGRHGTRRLVSVSVDHVGRN